jgi:hypothetical protein
VTVEDKIKRALADAARISNEGGVVAQRCEAMVQECLAHARSGKPIRLIQSKFTALMRDRNLLGKLIARGKAKIDVVNKLIQSADLTVDQTNEVTQLVTAVLDGLHRTMARMTQE